MTTRILGKIVDMPRLFLLTVPKLLGNTFCGFNKLTMVMIHISRFKALFENSENKLI